MGRGCPPHGKDGVPCKRKNGLQPGAPRRRRRQPPSASGNSPPAAAVISSAVGGPGACPGFCWLARGGSGGHSARRQVGGVGRARGGPGAQCLHRQLVLRGRQLRIATLRPVRGRDDNLDVGVDAAVLHSPAVGVQPDGVLRDRSPSSRRPAGTHSSMPMTPPQVRALHHRAEPDDAQRGGDHVPVGARELVRERHDRARGTSVRVCARPPPACQVPAHDPPGELLHHQFGHVAAAVLAHVRNRGCPGPSRRADRAVEVRLSPRPSCPGRWR